MADLKISQLTNATTPLAGTEAVPLIQSSTTRKVSIANLTAGRTVDVAMLLANSVSVDNNWKVQANASSNGLAGIGVNNNGGYGAYLIYDNSGRYAGGGAAIRNIANTPIYLETNNTIIGQFTPAGNYKPIATKGLDYSANTPAAGMTSQLLNWYEEGTWTPNQGGGLTVVGAFSSQGKYTRVGRQVTIIGSVSGATSISVNANSQISTNLPFATGVFALGSAMNNAATTFSTTYVATSTIYSASAIGATTTISFQITYFV